MLPHCTFADVISSLKAGNVADDGSDEFSEFRPIDVLINPGGPGTRLTRIYSTDATV